MSLKQKAMKGVIWSGLQKWGGHVISFSVFLLLARLLQPEDFGLVAMAGVFIAFMKVFLDQGFASAIIQRQEVEQEHLDTAFWVGFGSSLLLMLIAIASAELVASFYQEPELANVIRCLSISFPLKALNSVQSAILTRKFAFKTLAVRSLIAMTVGGTVGATMAFLNFGVWSLVCYQLSTSLVEVIVLWSVSDWRPGLKVSRKHLQELFSYGINVIGLNGLNFLNRYSDNLLIGRFLGSEALGYYTVAYRVLTVLIELLSKTTAQVAFPAFSKLQNEPKRLRNAFYKATQFTSLVSLPAFLGVFALAPEIVEVMFGSQWSPSIPVMQVLTSVGILQTISHFNGPIMMAMGKPGWRLGINTLGTGVNVISFILVVRWGILAVAAAYAVRAYLLSPINLWVLRKLIGVKILTYLNQLTAPLLGSLVMVLAIFGSKQLLVGWLKDEAILVICITIGIVAYGLTMRLIAPKLFQQVLELVRSVLPKSAGKKT
ncbi:MAG: MOP flippase family protein [Coleofasciculaceae cyanobacterium]